MTTETEPLTQEHWLRAHHAESLAAARAAGFHEPISLADGKTNNLFTVREVSRD